MTPKAGFDAALDRANHLLRLYELFCDTRTRGVRRDWARSFKDLMHWPDAEEIVRVDGKDRNSLLILREACGIQREHFSHDYLSELLRSAVVAAVSALDRFMHDLVVKHSWKLLGRREERIPKSLKGLTLTALDTRRALEHLRRDASARPGNLVKKAIQDRLHRDFTFQSPDSVHKAGKEMLGIADFWTEIANQMPGSPASEDVIETLRLINTRRNQIVHEADLVRTSRREPALRDISYVQAERWIIWMRDFGNAIQTVVDNRLV
jgi:hypothetical protein